MQHIIEGLKKAWENGPGAFVGSLIGAFIGLAVWSGGKSPMEVSADNEGLIWALLVGGAIGAVIVHLIVEAVRGKDSFE